MRLPNLRKVSISSSLIAPAALYDGVEQRRGVALAEDEVVVARVVRRAEVVVEVPREEDGHQVRGGHRARSDGRSRPPRWSGSSRRGAEGPARPQLEVSLDGHACSCSQVVCRSRVIRPFYGRLPHVGIGVAAQPGTRKRAVPVSRTPPVGDRGTMRGLAAHHPEAVAAVHRPRPGRAERHLRVLAAAGADGIVHLARTAACRTAVVATAPSRSSPPPPVARRCDRQDAHRLGAEVKPFSAKNSCSDAEKTKSIPQSAQVIT